MFWRVKVRGTKMRGLLKVWVSAGRSLRVLRKKSVKYNGNAGRVGKAVRRKGDSGLNRSRQILLGEKRCKGAKISLTREGGGEGHNDNCDGGKKHGHAILIAPQSPNSAVPGARQKR